MTMIEIFTKYWLKSRFSGNFDQNYDLLKILTKIKIFDDFQQNQEFSKVLTKIEIFGNFDQMRGLRGFFFLPKSRFSQILGTVKISKQNRDFPKILTKIEIF